jgi:methylase of polypeptide subunit release factors
MPSNDPNGHVHDVSGQDGRDAVNQILVESAKYLNDDGSLYLLVFDFLGVDESFNSQPSLFDLAKTNGFKTAEIIHSTSRSVRKGGETEKNIEHILSQYPSYKFKKDSDGKTIHEIYIVKFTK